ncbi:HDIG domain-containing metalloprotein [Aggregatilinea lenta]|uniref:HDIG domain-containing metalloprotein n=1 Tax=Aggregatilinea lenta TaxID=913108 RepID=UPI000E5ADDE9|nr:HDIG domain-containing metalloprotein [Aggregatilinea lenta]
MNREQAWKLVTEWTESQSLIRHMLSVEVAMRAYAQHFGADEEKWGVTGLLHDFDYERYPDMTAPDGHPFTGMRVLRDMGVDEDIVQAIAAHAAERTGVEPETPMQKSLVAVDELTGFLTAVALVRPSKDIRDITKIKSVRNKWKDHTFAAGVHRGEIEEAAQALGVDLWEEHVPRVLAAMQAHADELGLSRENGASGAS